MPGGSPRGKGDFRERELRIGERERRELGRERGGRRGSKKHTSPAAAARRKKTPTEGGRSPNMVRGGDMTTLNMGAGEI